MQPPRPRVLAIFALICIWFLAHAWIGLRVFLGADDFMNLYGAFIASPKDLILSNLFPVSGLYRPFGSLVYLVLFKLFGFNALAFRVFAYALMLLNLWLLVRFAGWITGRWPVALLAAFLASYSPWLYDLYLNNGTLYDLLCFTFTIACLSYYAGIRRRGLTITPLRGAVIAGLSILAINSKEMAAPLPAFLLAFDLAFTPPKSWRPAQALRWLFRDRLVVWLVLVLFYFALAAKTGPGTPLTVSAYHTEFTWQRFSEVAPALLHQLFLLPGDASFSAPAALVAMLAPLALGLALRKPAMVFCGLFILLAPLPILFIPFRGLFVMYLPIAGWAIFVAELAILAWDRVWRSVGRPAPVAVSACAVLLLAGYLHLQYAGRGYLVSAEKESASQARSLLSEWAALQLPIKKGDRILLLQDSFGSGEWTPLFILRLLHRDPELVIDRVKMMDNPPSPEGLASYNYVLDQHDGRTILVRRSP